MSEEVTAVASTHPLFLALEEHARRALLSSSRMVSFRADRTIFREGEAAESVYFLLLGAVRLFHKSGDAEVTVEMLRAPALFGEMEVLGGRNYLAHAKTLERSEILLVPASLFRQLVDKQPAFTAVLARSLSARLLIASWNERCLAFDDIDTRLANLLLDYVSLAGDPCDGGVRIRTKLSQERMAADLGVSRRSVIRSLDRFEALGLVHKSNGRYLIRDLDALRARGSERAGIVCCL